MLRASESASDLWAKAAELERDFAGYKRRLAERRACAAAVAQAGSTAGVEDEEEEGRGGGDAAGRGRRYEEYVRRRDERLRQEWRSRMERKEAEMKALWARLDRAGSRGRRAGEDGELASASHDREQKPGSLEVKVKPTAPVTPRCTPPSTKLSRPRTSVPPSPAAASPRLSTPDVRRRPSHPHRDMPPAAPPATTPRKENRLPPPSTAAAATPRPRTAALSRSRSMVKDRSSCSSIRDSPRPPRFQPPRTSCDGVSYIEETPLLPDHGADAVAQSMPFFGENAVLGLLKKACAAAPEPFHISGRSGNASRAASSFLVTTKDEPDCSETAPAAGCNADSKCNEGNVDRSSDKSGSPDITGDSDTEPSYVYIKRESGEQTPRSTQALVGLGTWQRAELRTEDKDSCNVEAVMASSDANTIGGEIPMADEEEASRRASSESLYSNVRSSFSQRSELDTSATNSPLRDPPSCSTPPTDPSPVDDARRPRNKPEEEDAEKNLQTPATPGSSVTVSITAQSPMDAVTGLKRFLTFGKKNGKAGEAATTVVDSAPHSLGTGSSDTNAASDDPENSYVISPQVGSLQSFVPSCRANPELKEAVLHAKSPRVRSFFSLPSFKSRAN